MAKTNSMISNRWKVLIETSGNKFYWLVFFIIIGFIGRGLILGTGNIIANMVDSLAHQNLPATDTCFAFKIKLIVFLLVMGFALTWVFRVNFSNLLVAIVSKIHDNMIWRVSRYPQHFFDTHPVGKIVTRFASDYGNVFRMFGGPLAEFMSIIFDLIFICLLMAISNYRFLPFLFVSIGLHIVVYASWKDRLRKNREDLSRNRAPGIAHFAETVQGAVTIRVFQKEKNFIEKFQELDNLFLSKKYKTLKDVFWFSIWLNLLAFFFYLSLAIFSWYGIKNNWVTIGEIGLSFGLIALSSNTVQMFFDWLAQFEETIVGLDRLTEFLYLPLEPGLEDPNKETPITKQGVIRGTQDSIKRSEMPLQITPMNLSFEKVWFRYHENQNWILKDVTFSIASNTKLGIIGPTGSGKSSLVQCLFQNYPIQKGTIRIGPFTLPHLFPNERQTLDMIRSLYAFIPQDPLILKGTLRDNIDPEHKFTDDQITNALKKIQYRDWDRNFHFVIQEKGRNLSSGEKQLIQLTRALLLEKPIVILDEATSNIDPVAEKLVTDILDQYFCDKIVIIIAHRLDTIKSCDQILWLQSGTIRMIDSPARVIPEFLKSDHSMLPLPS
ncbi:MAG: ABC transporter ATP-binding protein/permease [Bdellovibrionaceae bacterium]|nr:ABC transporter ATP-binding protein/permease [Pseudobdellovibrionaceae bacterium]MDW8190856.1 ABC transporter ATP-binding protein [Pseudobdellovibrionaceae bacterium]